MVGPDGKDQPAEVGGSPDQKVVRVGVGGGRRRSGLMVMVIVMVVVIPAGDAPKAVESQLRSKVREFRVVEIVREDQPFEEIRVVDGKGPTSVPRNGFT